MEDSVEELSTAVNVMTALTEIGNCIHRPDPGDRETKTTPGPFNKPDVEVANQLQRTNLSNITDDSYNTEENTMSTTDTDICEGIDDTEKMTPRDITTCKDTVVLDTEERPRLKRQDAVSDLHELWSEDSFFTPVSQLPPKEDVLIKSSAIFERSVASGGTMKKRFMNPKHFPHMQYDGTCGCTSEDEDSKPTGALKKPARVLSSTPTIFEETGGAENAEVKKFKLPLPTFAVTPEKENLPKKH